MFNTTHWNRTLWFFSVGRGLLSTPLSLLPHSPRLPRTVRWKLQRMENPSQKELKIGFHIGSAEMARQFQGDRQIVARSIDTNRSMDKIPHRCRVPHLCHTARKEWGIRIFCVLDFCGHCCHFRVPAGTPSRGGDITVYAPDISQSSLPTPFILCLYLFLPLWPFQLYFIPWILPTTLRFLTLFFWSYSASLVFSTIYLFMKVSLSPDIILCGWLGLKHQLTNCHFRTAARTCTADMDP